MYTNYVNTLNKVTIGSMLYAISVSESIVDKVRHYIANQEMHHAQKTFQQEYDELIKKLNF